MKKNILNITLSILLLLFVYLIFTPYFTKNFLQLRQQKEEEENHQKLLKEEQIIKEVAEKNYLTGKFEPAKRNDFIRIPDKYTLGGIKIYTRKETYTAFLKMEKSALLDNVNLHIVSATRNFDYQKNLWNNKWTGVTFVDGKDLSKSIKDGQERFEKILEYSAAPGTSRHHWGTDIDINGVNPNYFDTKEGIKQYEWLKINAPLFGFCQVYNIKDDYRPTGYNEEKWHWSYLPLSKNFTEEYKNLIEDKDIKGFLGDEYVSSFDLINDYVLAINPECL
ncbi:MAG: M15 family metallopeptidase [bacterium]